MTHTKIFIFKYIMAVSKSKILIIVLSGLAISAFICIFMIFIFQRDIYKYLFINENKNKAFETLSNVQLRLVQSNYNNNYNDLFNCLKRYNEILYPNIYISHVLINRSNINNQYYTIYKSLNIQSVYSLLEPNIIFNIIKDKICLVYVNNTTT